MPSELTELIELVDQTLDRVTSSRVEWLKYLTVASRMYKYSSRDQLLIFAQQPNASACADIPTWNTLGRIVNRDATGIALIDARNVSLQVKFVFDIIDTDFGKNAPAIYVWDLKQQFQDSVMAELSDQYDLDYEANWKLPQFIDCISEAAVKDSIDKYLPDFLDCRDDSLFGDLDEHSAIVFFRETVIDSVIATLSARCGISDGNIAEDRFRHLLEHSNRSLKIRLCETVSNISRSILREIERVVKQLHCEEERTNIHGQEYDSNESDLQQTGGLSNPEYKLRGEELSAGILREETLDVHNGISEGAILRVGPDQHTSGSPEGDRRSGQRDGRPADSGYGSATGRDGAAEGAGYDGVGAPDEQHPKLGEGDRSTRSDLRVDLPSPEQQREAIKEAEDDKSSAFVISQQDIDNILRSGTSTHGGKYRVALQYQKHESTKQNAAFLKKEYGTGGRTSVNCNKDISEWHDGKGIRLTLRSHPDTQVVLSWSKVASRIGLLIEADRYLTQSEKEYLPHYEEDMEKHRQEFLNHVEPEHIQPDRETADYVVRTGDRVYIDGIEHEISYMDQESILISDPAFPIFQRTLSFDEFGELIRQSPFNDRYIQKEPEKTSETDALSAAVTISIHDSLEKSAIAHAKIIDPEVLHTSSLAPSIATDAGTIVEEEAKPDKQEFTTAVSDINVSDNDQETYPEPAKVNYSISVDQPAVGGPKARFAANVAAIKTLQEIESQGRQASSDEQSIMARYVGWGGVSQAFDSSYEDWAKEYAVLKELLTEDEYAAARESTLTAFYTPPVIVKAMYDALADMGFRNGNILDPGCGNGTFCGLLPKSMQGSKYYGIEVDSISGRIAQQLYPESRIAVEGFEKTKLPDSFFDLAVGNVPFGEYKVSDRKYDKLGFRIHDYFFAKTLDKVRPGGIVAFITSSFTMDKQNAAIRRYIAQRAELIGAVRLPNNAFRSAGTDVVADIIFLQKRDRLMDVEADWTQLDITEDGYDLNRYFVEHPEMVLGTLKDESTRFGMALTCAPIEGANLADQLRSALSNMNAKITEFELDPEAAADDKQTTKTIPADPTTRNFSFCLYDGSIYYRENSTMSLVDVSGTAEQRIRGMIVIRDCVRTILDEQLAGCSDETLADLQERLNMYYDAYVKDFDRLSSRGNKLAFEDDSSYPLLCALEVYDDGKFKGKADIFTKRTIRQEVEITHVNTSAEALAVCIGTKAKVDLEFMSGLLDGADETYLASELKGVIFQNPETEQWEMADEYLSGNVRQKLVIARHYNEQRGGIYAVNVEALEASQPKDLKPEEIDVRLGATWIDASYYNQFMYELFDVPLFKKQHIHIKYSKHTDAWRIEGKGWDESGTSARITYGTKRKSGYELLQDTLNLTSTQVYDTVETPEGGEKRVLNGKETILAQQKQDLIKAAFKDWIFRDPDRRATLVRQYNDTFNSIVPRHYDGSHIRFVGMNPEISLRKHQEDAVARALYGGNTLLAHCVGAGKTYTMASIAMESKRLGLCEKSIFVVPNHLISDWCSEFLRLYPAANLLMSTEKDFETANRKRFCARIATGDYDAVIIGHSQFERIPISEERQAAMLNRQIDEITAGIEQVTEEKGERFTIKQMEILRKQLEGKLEKLTAKYRKDSVVTFEELGVDKLFVDEADGYKNLFLFSKMRNVSGISTTEAQKSTDMFNKCQYLDELTGSRGIVFATGTPISNSMTELYTMMRYLQYQMLVRMDLSTFDAWASTFGEVVATMELAPEGTTYRLKSRFSRFYNLPELMNLWREAADIQTSDMLNLPVPQVEYHTEVIEPTDLQRAMLKELGERADIIRKGGVDPAEDNMLRITGDGRKLALDQRLIDPSLSDEVDTKVNHSVEKIYQIWQNTADIRGTQLLFCDMSTPGKSIIETEEVDGVAVMTGFQNIYQDIRTKLITKGIPEEEVAFIHDAKTQPKKAALFSQVRNGHVRILLGSTAKMGAGTNVQRLLIALHHLDVPWRPRDIEQREGRIIRQGNLNPVVSIYRYVTKDTFDAYSWQTIENKQKFIGQVMTGKSPARSCEDVDSTALSFAEVKALASGNPYIKEKMNLEIDVAKLTALKANHRNEQYQLEDRAFKQIPAAIAHTERKINDFRADIELAAQLVESDFSIELEGVTYSDKALAMETLHVLSATVKGLEIKHIGHYKGFALSLAYHEFEGLLMHVKATGSYSFPLGKDLLGNATRLNNVISRLPAHLAEAEGDLLNLNEQLVTTKAAMGKPFLQEQELQEKSERLNKLNIKLSRSNKNSEEQEYDDDYGMEA